MKVTLNIENDAELRSHIKDAIKGQVLSIIREEFSQIISEELTRIMKSATSGNFDYQIRSSMNAAVEKILRDNHGVSTWDASFIQPFVNKRLDDVLTRTNWNKLVDTLAKEKVKALIQ